MSKSQTTELKNVLDCNKAFLRNKEIYKKKRSFPRQLKPKPLFILISCLLLHAMNKNYYQFSS